jgi:SAM-dependent methyltransferase
MAVSVSHGAMVSKPNQSTAAPRIFSRARIRHKRERGAVFPLHDFLHRRAMADIVDRLETVTRRFDQALLIGVGDLADMLTPDCGVGAVTQMDAALSRLDRNSAVFVAEEDALPVADQSVDLIVSLLTLHAINDFVGALTQARRALKPDGLFVAAVFGEGTLSRLRAALLQAEAQATGAAASRIAPFAAIQDFGQALMRAGFAMPVTDTDEIAVAYEHPANLLKDLRGMGETGALAGSPAPLPRSVLSDALRTFQDQGGEERFTIAYLTGWAPAASQPQPLKPGSATASMADAVKRFERS